MLGMNIDGLVSKYFGECDSLPIIEMFDSESIQCCLQKCSGYA